jgi:transposase InsO family protein
LGPDPHRQPAQIAGHLPLRLTCEEYPSEARTAKDSCIFGPIPVLAAIDDFFSRQVVCIAPLEGPNTGWIIEALEQTLQKRGARKRIISDQATVLAGGAFAELLRQRNVKPRFEGVGEHESITRLLR